MPMGPTSLYLQLNYIITVNILSLSEVSLSATTTWPFLSTV